MFVGMTSAEYADWHRFYCTHYFQDIQLDMHFPGLTYAVLSLFLCDLDVHPSNFSLLIPRREKGQVERPDEDKMLMQKTAELVGGVRSDGDGGRDVLSSTDVTGVMVDDAVLMVVSVGILEGVRCVPVGW